MSVLHGKTTRTVSVLHGKTTRTVSVVHRKTTRTVSVLHGNSTERVVNVWLSFLSINFICCFFAAQHIETQ